MNSSLRLCIMLQCGQVSNLPRKKVLTRRLKVPHYLKENSNLTYGERNLQQQDMIGILSEMMWLSMVPEILYSLLPCQLPQQVRSWETMKVSNLIPLMFTQEESWLVNSSALIPILFKTSLKLAIGLLMLRMLSLATMVVSKLLVVYLKTSRTCIRLSGKFLKEF